MEVQIVGRNTTDGEEDSQYKLIMHGVTKQDKKRFIRLYACDVGRPGEDVKSVMFYVDAHELLMAAEMLS